MGQPSSQVKLTATAALGLFTVFDVVVSGALVFTWALLGLVSVGVGVAGVCLRLGLWFGLWFRRMGPLLQFEREGDEASDELLHASNSRLDELLRLFPWLHALLWTVTQLAWVGAAELGIGVAYGSIERIAALMCVASVTCLGGLTYLLFDTLFGDLRERLTHMLAARELDAPRPRSTIARPLVNGAMALLLGGVLVVIGAALVWNAQQHRELTQAQLRAEVELAALQLRVGEQPREGIEALTPRELPPPLQPRLSEPQSGFVLQRGEALAAAPIEGGYVLARAQVDAELSTMATILLAVLLLACPLFALGLTFFGRSISNPLTRLASATEGFVDRGELHELERLVVVRNDEIGRLTRSFNAMLDVLVELSQTAEAVSQGKLRAEFERPGALHDAFRTMLANLNEIVMRMRVTVIELAGAAAELTSLTEAQDAAAQAQADSVKLLTENLASLANTAEQISGATQSVQRDADEAVSTSAATSAAIATLRDESNGVTALLQQIDEIAKRSDLLALNGSLEATRAGEAGRGFALVAAEMRSLAERVTGTVQDVRARVEAIEAAGHSAVMATEQSRAIAERTAASAAEIAAALVAHSDETTMASAGLELAATELTNTTAAMTQTRAAAEHLREQAGALEAFMDGFELVEDEPAR